MTIIWCMVPEIWSKTSRVFFFLFFSFCHLDYFLHFYPPNNLKNQNFEIMKKPPGASITLNMCTINENHMMYGSWDMEHERQNFLSFWTIFCPDSPKKSTFWKNKKKSLEILSFYTCVPKMTIIWCMVPDIPSLTESCFFCHFGPFFALLPA